MKYIGYFFVLFSVFILFPIIKNCSQSKVNIRIEDAEEKKEVEKKDAVFIMGEDAADAAPYYTLASQYYAAQYPEAEHVHSLRSLAELRNYLALAEQPWANIYLIVHGNPWTGLNMSIQPDGPRINTEDLAKVLKQKSFVPVSNDLINDQTTIHLEACGLGNDPLLLHQLARALGGDDFQVPLVKASKHFISFIQQPDNPQQIHKYYSKPFFTFFETAKKPALLKLQRQLSNMYPKAKVDWMKAMNRPASAPGFQPKFQQFNVPVSWTSVFLEAANIPDFKELDRPEILDWVAAQEELAATIDRIGISMEDFRWQFKTSEYLLASGEQLPAVEIKGKTTVLCILEPIEIVPIAEATEVADAEQFDPHFGYSALAMN